MWKDIVKQFAPKLGAALGGPMAGIATKFIAGKLLNNENASDKELDLAIAGASPKVLANLRKAEKDFEKEILSLQVEDRKSAREMYTASKNKNPQIILSVVYTLGYFGVLFGLMTDGLTIPIDHKDLFLILFGILTAAQTQILNFWFGSSSGSKDKNK